jgi:uncharacterized protein (DUF433 family)
MPPATISIPEASFVAGIPIDAVNRAIKEEKLPSGVIREDHRYVLTREAVLLLAVESEIERLVPEAMRRDLVAQAAKALTSVEGGSEPGSVSAREGAVEITVLLSHIVSRVASKWQCLMDALGAIVVDPDIQAGAPVFRDTRIMVHPVAEALERGVPASEILDDYPALTPDLLEAARLYAKTHPRRSRPSADTTGLVPRSVRRWRVRPSTSLDHH